jgi:hypothetical protein
MRYANSREHFWKVIVVDVSAPFNSLLNSGPIMLEESVKRPLRNVLYQRLNINFSLF